MVFFITNKFQLIFSPNVFSLSLQLPDPSAPQPVGLKSPLLSEFPPLILCVGDNKTIAEFSFCWIFILLSYIGWSLQYKGGFSKCWKSFPGLFFGVSFRLPMCVCCLWWAGSPGSSLGWHRRRRMVVVGQQLQHCWTSSEIKMDRLIICEPCHFFKCYLYLYSYHLCILSKEAENCDNFLAA